MPKTRAFCSIFDRCLIDSRKTAIYDGMWEIVNARVQAEIATLEMLGFSIGCDDPCHDKYISAEMADEILGT